mgnify:CR=1 FL=1
MIETEARLKKYSNYKDSGVVSLGDIPNHWQILPLFTITELKSVTNQTENDLLSIYLDLGVVRFSDVKEKRTNATSKDLSKYQLVEPGDFVLNNQQAWRGSVGVSKYKGIISPAYIVLSLSEKLNTSFANYFFRDRSMVTQYLINSKGVGSIQRNLYYPHLRRANISLPPLQEQKAIAEFLDGKTQKIDEAIAIKKQQIALLQERQQILIQNAVTGKIVWSDKKQKMIPLAQSGVDNKNSGVSWIGEIPEHWEVTAVKHVLEMPITDGPHITPKLLDNGIPFISAEAIKNGIIDFDKKTGYISYEDYQLFCSKYQPKLNDIYMVKSGATTGNIAMVNTGIEFNIWSPLAVFRSNQKKISPKHLYNYLSSPTFSRGIQLSWSFGTQQNIGMRVLSNLPISTPPLSEQKEISNYIENASQKTTTAISYKQQEIEKLREYKSSLINSCVTGKIKVN